MRIDIIAVVPELLQSPFQHSIFKRAVEKGLASVYFHDLRQYGLGNYKQIDDYSFGGGAGMVLMIEPIDACISALKAERNYDEVIYLTPDGHTLNQPMANALSLKENNIHFTPIRKSVVILLKISILSIKCDPISKYISEPLLDKEPSS